VLGTPVRDHELPRVNEERGWEADKENGTEGEECMKLELERKEKTRARKISRFRRGLKKGVGEALKLERSGKVLLMNYPEAIIGRGRLNRIRNREFTRWVEIPSRTKRSSNEGKLGEYC
jgi:hypothetical protein